MKKELTKIVCERCGHEKILDARKLGLIHKSASYPKDWQKIWKGLRVCPSCGADWQEAWNKYLAGGVVTANTKIMKAKH